MLKKGSSYLIILFGLILMSFIGKAVTVYKVSESSKFIVAGTSTLHDWEMVSSEAVGDGEFVIKDKAVQNIKSLSVKLKSETLESGKEKMDENAYIALKTDKNPYITFELDRVIAIKDNVMQLKGDFTAGGTTKTEVIEVTPKYDNGKITILGNFDITFKEYNMVPPTAVMGTIKTGNELNISFKVVFID
jgi:polyisoprenoid-binding protein YceI